MCGFIELSDYESHLRDEHADDLPSNSIRKFQRNIAITDHNEINYYITLESFKKKSESTIDTQSYSKKGPFTCTKCSNKYTSKMSLNRHFMTHFNGEKLFPCDHCNKKFTQISNLKTHLLIHTGEKLFSCVHCKKKFLLKAHLKSHLLIHTGKKLFCCDHCDRKCSYKSNLKTHLKIHTGEKSFSCFHCEKKFLRKDTLKTHWGEVF